MKQKVNPVLERILETGQFEGPDGQLLNVRAQISSEAGEFLQKIIADTKPVTTLEVGLAYGFSAMFICDALERTPGTRHIVMDSHQLTDVWNKGAGLHNLKQAGYEDIIEFHNMDSQRALPLLAERGTRIDFAFIDGAHTFDHALVDFFYIDRLLQVGGVIAFDDVNFPSVRKVCRFALKNRNYSVYADMEPEEPRETGLRSRIRQTLQGAARFLARYSRGIEHLLAPEILQPDSTLGIKGGRVLAIKKENEDTRGHTHAKLGHHDF